jgi:hypothetical protein
MSHDSAKVVLAAALSNHKDIANFDVDPAGFPAGLCVSLASTGLPSLLKSAGMRYGISRGKSFSDHKKTAIQQAGLRVPVRAALKRSTGLITVTNVANLVSGTDDSVTVGATVFTAQAGAATPGDATFQATGTTAATATSLATQINAHATASTLVYAIASAATVRLYAKVEGAGTGHDVAVAYTDNDANVGITLSELSAGKLAGGSNTISDIAYAVIGTKMYINDVSGKADIAMTGFSTVSDAVYVSGPKTGIAEDASEVGAALVDMQGGL